MSFANPAGNAKVAASEYTRALLGVLGERAPLDVFPETPKRLRAIVAEVPDSLLRRPEREGKWSMIQVLQHLADTELVYSYRYRMPVAQDEPSLQGIDQDLWTSRLWKSDARLEDVLTQFESLRAINIRYLRQLTDDEWDRAGTHEERGRETVRHMTRLGGGHDLVHLAQLERIKRAVSA